MFPISHFQLVFFLVLLRMSVLLFYHAFSVLRRSLNREGKATWEKRKKKVRRISNRLIYSGAAVWISRFWSLIGLYFVVCIDLNMRDMRWCAKIDHMSEPSSSQTIYVAIQIRRQENFYTFYFISFNISTQVIFIVLFFGIVAMSYFHIKLLPSRLSQKCCEALIENTVAGQFSIFLLTQITEYSTEQWYNDKNWTKFNEDKQHPDSAP